MTKSKNVELLIRGIPRALRDSYKSACDKRGRSMTEDLREHMFKYVSESSSLNIDSKNLESNNILEKLLELVNSFKEAIKNQDYLELSYLSEALELGIRNLAGDKSCGI